MNIQVTRILKSLLNSILGNFVKNHSLVARIFTADDFPQVPGNSLSLAVQIRRQIDMICLFSILLQFVDHFFLARQNFVFRLPVIVGVNTHLADECSAITLCLELGLLFVTQTFRDRRSFLDVAPGARRQIAHMAHTGLNDIVLAKVLVDRLCLSRRLYYY